MSLYGLDLLLLTVERLWLHRLLVLWVLVGIAVAVILALSLPLYVDAVYSDVLASRLQTPPYAFRFRYLGAWNGNISQADFESGSSAIQEGFTAHLDLPIQRSVDFVRVGTWSVRTDTYSLGNLGIGTLEGASDQILISNGAWPPAETGEAIPVLLPETLFYTTGVQVGDTLTAQRAGGGSAQLIVAALWRPVNEHDPAWVFPPKYFDQVALVQADDLWNLVEGIENPVDEGAWYVVFDGSSLRSAEVNALLDRITEGIRIIDRGLPGVRQDEISPVNGLRRFNDDVTQMTQQLFIIVAPVGGLVLYFVALVAGLLVNRQQPEDVKLRSRGMSRASLMLLHLQMWLLLVGISLAIGIAVSPMIVQLVGRTTSFLKFEDTATIPAIKFTPRVLMIGAFTGLLAASNGIIGAWRTTRQNITTFQRSISRAGKAWWQRANLDLMMLAPGFYVFYTLTHKNGIKADVDTPFADPVTFIGPTLLALGLALLFLRLLPALLTILSKFVAYTSSVALLMALREITRSMGRYRGVLLMLTFTLSLTGFTASMASTLDRSLEDTINYRVGADLVMITDIDTQDEQEFDSSTGQTNVTVTGYNMPPVESLQGIEGIAYLSRFGSYDARLALRSQNITGTLIGVDRTTLAAVTRFRQDFATLPLADLMNRLAEQRTGIIINRQTAEAYDLVIGQEVELQVSALETWYETRVLILDIIDYFPTLDPGDGFFAITNLDPIFELVGTPLPYNIWLHLEPGADPEKMVQAARAEGFPITDWNDPESAMQIARSEPGRRGVLGFLSIGFVASIALTLIAEVIQSAASFQTQARQLGVLRAMGLSGTSVAAYMLLFQMIAAATSILSGTLIGVLVTLLFLPLLDFSGGLPPYQVRVAWSDISSVYLLFAGMFFMVAVLTVILMGRRQLTTIVRLGEA